MRATPSRLRRQGPRLADLRVRLARQVVLLTCVGLGALFAPVAAGLQGPGEGGQETPPVPESPVPEPAEVLEPPPNPRLEAARRRRAAHKQLGGSINSGPLPTGSGKGSGATGAPSSDGSGSSVVLSGAAAQNLPAPVRAPDQEWKAYTIEWRGATSGETLSGGTVLSARNAGVVSYKGSPHRGHVLQDLLIQPAPSTLTWWGVRAFEVADWTFQDVEVRGMGGKPGKPEGHAFYGNVAGNLTFRSCWFHDNKGQAVQVVARPHSGTAPAVGQLLIEECLFENNGFDSDRAGFQVSVFGPGTEYDVLIRDTIIRTQGLPPYEYEGVSYGARGGLVVAPVSGVTGDSVWHDTKDPQFTNGVVRLERVTIDLERPFQPLALFKGVKQLEVEGCTFLGGDVVIDAPEAHGRNSGSVVWKGNQGDGRVLFRGKDVGPVTQDFVVEPSVDEQMPAAAGAPAPVDGAAGATGGASPATESPTTESTADPLADPTSGGSGKPAESESAAVEAIEPATTPATGSAAAVSPASGPEDEAAAASPAGSSPTREPTPAPEGWVVVSPAKEWTDYTVAYRDTSEDVVLEKTVVRSARSSGVVSYKGASHRRHVLRDVLIEPAPGRRTWWGVRVYEISDWRFERVEIQYMGGPPGKPEGHAFYGNVAGNLSFEDCYFHDNRGQAVQVVARPHSGTAPARGTLRIVNCRFERNGFESDRAGFPISVFGPGPEYDVELRDTVVLNRGMPPYRYGGKEFRSRGGVLVAPVNGKQGDSIWFDPADPEFTNGRVVIDNLRVELEKPFQAAGLFRGIRELEVRASTFLGGDVHIDNPGQPGRRCGSIVWEGNQGDGTLFVDGAAVGPVTQDFRREPEPEPDDAGASDGAAGEDPSGDAGTGETPGGEEPQPTPEPAPGERPPPVPEAESGTDPAERPGG